ncbi:hypothetical protein LQ564_14625 [Massilia sp. G4R7]|uniref:Uncharacterized protein n=1 Tax=Massilia phyllostachyos TaxID=2898585 RepID=A0ABS8Q720_9BURK|nr:hypothetical protein [Massilia phyllostachyos]MCD2517547.1 hypothetical protein [Massilia phyllostachyos]
MDQKVPADWKALAYLRPAVVLDRLRRIATSGMLTGLPEDVQNLRRRDLHQFLEGRQAALFCHGVGRALGVEVTFALCEKDDYDFIATYRQGDAQIFVPVQLKELVPLQRNRKADLQSLLDSVSRKYPTSKDLVVAIHINRDITDLRTEELRLPRGVGELWFFGARDHTQQRWMIVGDLLRNPNLVREFNYPRPQSYIWQQKLDGLYGQRNVSWVARSVGSDFYYSVARAAFVFLRS